MYSDKTQQPDPPSRKLIRTFKRMMAMVKNRNFAASIIIYEPGNSLYGAVIDPKWSRVKFPPSGRGLYIDDNLEHYNSEEHRLKELEATMTMLVHLANMSRVMFQNFNTMATDVEKRAKVTIPEPPKQADKPVDKPVRPQALSQDEYVTAVVYALLNDPKATAEDAMLGDEVRDYFLKIATDNTKASLIRILHSVLIKSGLDFSNPTTEEDGNK